MMLPSFSKEELEKASRREELIEETIRQIIKDFSEFDLDIRFPGSDDDYYGHLFQQMQKHVTHLLLHHREKLFNLLYRIDLEVSDVDSYQKQMPEVPFEPLLTELIIHRELKKVITRDFFRQSGNQ
ncbi:hypothetical protein ACT29H_08080 [Thermophagus sp. OGC60D27]|uniref:hypothetical protein n=1 Tax=Thermophagus sp. OGC60D27 TaxID=3458415 RepID=UPI004037DCCE